MAAVTAWRPAGRAVPPDDVGTSEERVIIVAGIIAGFVGLALGLAHGGFEFILAAGSAAATRLLGMMRIGGHFHSDNPLDDAVACGARVAQFFLGDPQGWKGPVIPGGTWRVRDAYAAAEVDVYIHAPYVINVASTNNRIRIPSRKLLDQQLKAAASIGAKGLIVHGGHVTGDVDPAVGVENWVKAIEQIERPLPMLIENTAGGTGAMARSLEAIARLWEGVSAAADGPEGGTARSGSASIPATRTRPASTWPTRLTG